MAQLIRSVAWLVLASLLLVTPAAAQYAGQILFHNPTAGVLLTGGIDHQGRFVERSRIASSNTSRHFLAAGETAILGWSSSSGGFYYEALQLTPRGGIETVGTPAAPAPTVASMTPFGNLVLVYDGASSARLLEVELDGRYSQRWSTTSFSPWTNVVPTDNHLFFYNRNNGVIAILTTSWTNAHSNFVLLQTSNGTIGKAYRRFVTQADAVMAYDPVTGAYEIGAIPFTGAGNERYVRGASGLLPKGFDLAVRTGPHVVFHDTQTGTTLVGRIDRTPTKFVTWTPLKTFKLATGWNRLVAASQDLVFYNNDTGAMMVGRIDPTGAFVSSYTTNLGGGFTEVVASKR